jgi:hypothetical protein
VAVENDLLQVDLGPAHTQTVGKSKVGSVHVQALLRASAASC